MISIRDYICNYDYTNEKENLSTLDSRRKQDWRLFVIFAILGGILLVIMGIAMIASAVVLPGIMMLLLGVGLMVGSVYIFRTFFNTNLGKKNESIIVSYQMQSDSGVEILEELEALKSKLAKLEPGQEILITLTPEYFIMPTKVPAEALKHFAKVFAEYESVNTSNLIEMKRYNRVLEYYKLV